LTVAELTEDDWAVIDAFENPDYDLSLVQLTDARTAWAYTSADDTEPANGTWETSTFIEQHLRDYVHRCADWRARYSAALDRRPSRTGPLEIALRPAGLEDSEFCFRLHKAAMGEYVRSIWGWDEQLQRDYHDRGFVPGRWQIITVDRADVGVISVEYNPSCIYLARIEIHPGHQGRGIGSQLIRDLLDQAAASGRSVALDVFSINDRAPLPPARLHLHRAIRAPRHQDQNGGDTETPHMRLENVSGTP
jgi:GNAT superfamily N-acetyltransferase